MANGTAELDTMIARIKALPDLARVSAPDVARFVQKTLHVQISEGKDPQGKKWPPRQAGGQALQHGADALRVGAIGLRILATLKGYVALHHLGHARGGVERQILPIKRIPVPWQVGITNILSEHFGQIVKGGS